MKVVIDTDPGTDDCHALTQMLKLTNVVALTTVFGNVTQRNSATNACRILEYLGMNNIPVYNGAHCCLSQSHFHDVPPPRIHGSDGLNDAQDIIPMNNTKQPETDKSAPDAIIEIVKANPGEITLVALGPLTNIAIATKLCPELPKLVKCLYLMGSCSKHGNVTPWAEFNFHCDPLAAHVALQHFCKHALVHIVPWETCLENYITFKEFHSLFKTDVVTPARSLIHATSNTPRLLEREEKGTEGFLFADQFISMILVYPESVTESEHFDTIKVNCDKDDQKYGLAEYVKLILPESDKKGVVVYTKFDMKYMIKLYENTIKQ